MIAYAIEEFITNNSWQIDEILASIKEADAGDFASPEEVEAMFARLTGE